MKTHSADAGNHADDKDQCFGAKSDDNNNDGADNDDAEDEAKLMANFNSKNKFRQVLINFLNQRILAVNLVQFINFLDGHVYGYYASSC